MIRLCFVPSLPCRIIYRPLQLCGLRFRRRAGLVLFRKAHIICVPGFLVILPHFVRIKAVLLPGLLLEHFLHSIEQIDGGLADGLLHVEQVTALHPRARLSVDELNQLVHVVGPVLAIVQGVLVPQRFPQGVHLLGSLELGVAFAHKRHTLAQGLADGVRHLADVAVAALDVGHQAVVYADHVRDRLAQVRPVVAIGLGVVLQHLANGCPCPVVQVFDVNARILLQHLHDVRDQLRDHAPCVLVVVPLVVGTVAKYAHGQDLLYFLCGVSRNVGLFLCALLDCFLYFFSLPAFLGHVHLVRLCGVLLCRARLFFGFSQ